MRRSLKNWKTSFKTHKFWFSETVFIIIRKKWQMLKITIVLFLLFLLGLYLFMNLGRFTDVTEQPVKADIIVSFGGDSGSRIKRSLQLYKEGYSRSHKIIYTGGDQASSKPSSPFYSIKQYLLSNGLNEDDIVHIDFSMIRNTMEEIFFVKEYMLKHGMKHVLFVSTPFHSRRIKTLTDIVAKYDNAGLHYTIAGAYTWKNKSDYYKDKNIRSYVILEMEKLVYNLLKYGTPLIRYTRYYKLKENGTWNRNVDKL